MSRELWTPSTARVLVGAVFTAAGAAKALTPIVTASILASRGIPQPLALGVLLGIVEVAGGLALIMNYKTRPVALAMVGLILLATTIFHFPIVLAGPRALELALDIAMIGTLLWVFFATPHARREPA
jgi:putative oxidoreductase